jgi:hypothetical protein
LKRQLVLLRNGFSLRIKNRKFLTQTGCEIAKIFAPCFFLPYGIENIYLRIDNLNLLIGYKKEKVTTSLNFNDFYEKLSFLIIKGMS